MSTATIELPKPRAVPSASLALWWGIPFPVRTALRARVPLDAREVGGAESLIVAVGDGNPLRWLRLRATGEDGAVQCRLWEVRAKVKELIADEVRADELSAMLLTWAIRFGLS